MRPVYALLIFAIGTVGMMFLYGNELLLTAVMGIAAIIALWLDKWKDAKSFLIAVIVGGACENIAVMMGAWGYANASYLYTPLWLPIGWGVSVILLNDMVCGKIPRPRFSLKALALAFIGTIMTGLVFRNEIALFLLFALATGVLYLLGKYRKEELAPAIIAALLGTGMESACILTGSWHYSAAVFGTPIWLPLCWFNAFLIMRRIIFVK